MSQNATVPMTGQDIVLYDGTCGLCHRTVRFLLWADGRSERFRFAPLQGELFRALVPEVQRDSLPDSIVVRTATGELLARSAAVVYLLRKLGGVWRVLAALLRLVPTRWRNAAYDFIARRRRRWFRAPADACPPVPERLRSRFLR